MAYKHKPTQRDKQEMYKYLPDKLPFTPLQIGLVVAGGLCIAVTILWLLVMWSQIGDVVPTHYNFMGKADGWGSKKALWFLIAIEVGLYILLVGSLFFLKLFDIPYRYSAEDAAWVYTQMRSEICVEAFVITLVFGDLTYISAMGVQDVSAFHMLMIIALLSAPAIYYWRRLKQRAL